MKIFFCWPFESSIEESTESNEFYCALKNRNDVELIDDFNGADYRIFMMDIHNCVNMEHYKNANFKQDIISKIINHRDYEKDIIIDYNDWTDTRCCYPDSLMLLKKYFKRSVVDKNKNSFLSYPREIIPISYAVREDYINYDNYNRHEYTNYLYDVCCLFDKYGSSGMRNVIPRIIEKYNGPKHIGLVKSNINNYNNRYSCINENYYKVLKTSKIIVTANPPCWEGDFRLWEALLVGNLVMCDKMFVPHILKYPLINKTHLIFYENPEELLELINYYINNEDERNKIGSEGREYVLKYHKFSNRVNEVIESLK